MPEFEYANGADGFCCDCGEQTEEEWHLYCSTCYAEQQGWQRPDAGDEPERVTISQLLERLGELEVRIRRLERERAS